MLHDLLTFLPFIVCLFWMIVHCMTSFRTGSFSDIITVLAMGTVFFFIDGYYSSINNRPGLYLWLTLFNQIAATSFIPVIILYFNKLRGIKSRRKYSYIWVALPAALFSATGLLMSIAGSQSLAAFIQDLGESGVEVLDNYKNGLEYSYFIWSNILLRIVMAIELVYVLFYSLSICIRRKYSPSNIYKFLFKQDGIDVFQLELTPLVFVWVVYAARVPLLKPYLDSHPALTAVFSVFVAISLFLFGYFALFSEKTSITLRQAGNVMRYNYSAIDKQEIVEEMIGDLLDDAEAEALRHIRERIGSTPAIEAWEKGERGEPSVANSIFNAVADSWDEDSLMARFQRIMLEEQLYLQPRLSLTDIADRLESNKTYVSKMVNNTYNLSFPELLNTLRIDFAEHYIMVHKNAKQEQIAKDCGFLSASSFNTTFKKITGMTPKVWIASQEKNKK